MSGTRLTVCVGGGGVGKTTSAAALALHMARGGARTLVITVDPARRLADALGVHVGQATQAVAICPRAEQRLHAKMPDPRSSMGDFITWLFEDPVQRARVMQNPAYRELSDSLAGVHELLTIGLLQHEIDAGQFDEVVIDTAPSRDALAFLAYPARLLELLEARALAWLSSLAAANGVDGDAPSSARGGGLFAWGRAKVEGVFGRIVGLNALRNLSALFADLASVRGKWADLVRRTDTLLVAPTTRYIVIGAPSGGALADVLYLLDQLRQRSLRPSALVLNRAERGANAAERDVAALLDTQPGLLGDADASCIRSLLYTLDRDHAARVRSAEGAARLLVHNAPPGTPLIRLPFVGPASPRDIVLALADAWSYALADVRPPLP